MPVDHPLVAVAHGARLQLRRVRARRVRLGHAEGAAQVAGEQRVQPALLLLGRAGHREDLRVAGVGRGVAEGQRRDRRGAEDLVHQPEAHLAHALPAELGRQVRGPQPALLDLLLQRRDRLAQAVEAELVPDRLERPDLAADELGHPVELLLEVGVGGEVPAHAASFRSGAGRLVGGALRAYACPPAGAAALAPTAGRRVGRARRVAAHASRTVGRRDRARPRRPPADDARAREGAASSAPQGDRTREVTPRTSQHPTANWRCQGQSRLLFINQMIDLLYSTSTRPSPRGRTRQPTLADRSRRRRARDEQPTPTNGQTARAGRACQSTRRQRGSARAQRAPRERRGRGRARAGARAASACAWRWR